MSTEGVVIDFTPNPAYYTKNADLGRIVIPRIIQDHNVTGQNNVMASIIGQQGLRHIERTDTGMV